jgi:2',3'-cyclic-nucleotide 2'-phosphodiesterase / 3'-nucleotidase
MEGFRDMRTLLICLLLAASAFAREVKITVLATTDLHGNIYPYDYLTGRPAPRGLAKIATLIRAERAKNPNTLLIDSGDTIQGTPLESVWQTYVRTGKLPLGLRFPGRPPVSDPMMLVMNRLGYDAMTIGNHEFNFGLATLDRARADARFPWLAANVSGPKPFDKYIVKTVGGVTVGVIGITTPAVPTWEKPENYRAYTFVDAKAAALQAVAELKAKHKPDIVIASVHAGLERDPVTGAPRAGDVPRENMVYAIATEVPGIDAVAFGHTHQTVENQTLNGVVLVQPKNWGMSLGAIDFTVEPRPGGGWRVKDKSSRLIPVNKNTAADPEVMAIAAPYHEITERYLNTPVAVATQPLHAGYSRVEDSAMIDAIHEVQLHYAKADVSFASSFNPRAAIAKGPVTVRQIASLYLYDNELYAVEGTGKMVREALENAARFYNSCPTPACDSGPLINRGVIGYNYDIAQGVSYEIDVTRPVGQRVRNLRFRGAPLADERKLIIAVNNYRAGGSGGYTMFRGAPVVWRSYDDIRELMIRYYSERPFPSKPDGNWRVVPPAAAATLQRESRELGARPLTQ